VSAGMAIVGFFMVRRNAQALPLAVFLALLPGLATSAFCSSLKNSLLIIDVPRANLIVSKRFLQFLMGDFLPPRFFHPQYLPVRAQAAR